MKRPIDRHRLVRSQGYRFFGSLELAMKETHRTVELSVTVSTSWWDVVHRSLPPRPEHAIDSYRALRAVSSFAGPWRDIRAIAFVVQSAVANGDAHPVTGAIAHNVGASSSFQADIEELIAQINHAKHAAQRGEGRESLQSIVDRLTQRMTPMFRNKFLELLREMPMNAASCLFSRLDPRRDHSVLFLLCCPGDLSSLPYLRWSLVVDVVARPAS